MFYWKIFLVTLWMCITSFWGTLYAVWKWGDLNVDRDLARVFSWGALKILGIQIEVEGLEHIESHQPCIYTPNHQSNLDIAIFGGIYPMRTVVIGKKELRWVPFFGLFFVAAGNIMIDRKKKKQAVAGLSQAVDTVRKKGVSVWIFPEGTRNRSGDLLLPFKKGPFHMAIQAGVPVLPLVSAPLQTRVSWKLKRIVPGKLKIRVLPPVMPPEDSEHALEEFTQRVRNQMLEALRGLAV